MRIFDAHFHIDRGITDYNIQADKNYIFNSVDQYKSSAASVSGNDSVTLILDYKENWDFVKAELRSKRVHGIKIHSRIQKIKEQDYSELYTAYEEIAGLRIPTVVDAFYFGEDLEVQPNLQGILGLVKRFSDNLFIIAHSGGIRAMEYFLHLKNQPNVVFELSLSLAYLRHASAFRDFSAIMRFADKSKIIFGTDYPYIDPQEQLSAFMEIAEEQKLSDVEIDQILYTNAAQIFSTQRH